MDIPVGYFQRYAGKYSSAKKKKRCGGKQRWIWGGRGMEMERNQERMQNASSSTRTTRTTSTNYNSRSFSLTCGKYFANCSVVKSEAAMMYLQDLQCVHRCLVLDVCGG